MLRVQSHLGQFSQYNNQFNLNPQQRRKRPQPNPCDDVCKQCSLTKSKDDCDRCDNCLIVHSTFAPSMFGLGAADCVSSLQTYLYSNPRLLGKQTDFTNYFSFPKHSITGTWNDDTSRMLNLIYGNQQVWSRIGDPCAILTDLQQGMPSQGGQAQTPSTAPAQASAASIGSLAMYAAVGGVLYLALFGRKKYA